MSELETQPKPEQESVSKPEVERVTTETATTEQPKKSLKKLYIGAGLIVLLIALGVVYQLEKEGRSSTTIFSSMIESKENSKVVATVNGETVINADLKTSVEQFTQIAKSQGVDTSTPDVQAEIRSQALTVLINTTLLKQEADDRGLSVTDEELEERLETIKAEIGGDEVLDTRLEELGITMADLRQDVKDEILITSLLDEVFAENEIIVTEEEILAMYENAGGEDAGNPPLEEVRVQIEEQITLSKEQAIIDIFLEELKSESEIEVEGE